MSRTARNRKDVDNSFTVVSSTAYESKDCGWISLRPNFLQRFRTGRCVLFWLCLVAVIEGMIVHGFVNVSISTIEKRYNLKSATSGFIVGCYDLGTILFSIPLSYMGSLPHASKPRWIGWGILLMGIGALTFSSPHFLSSLYMIDRNSQENITESLFLCSNETAQTDKCGSEAQESTSNIHFLFFFAHFLTGVGTAPLFTLGITYLDESVPMKLSSFYLGIFNAMVPIGSAVGYVFGGRLLNIFIDYPNAAPEGLGITRASELWLGAWWIGFIICGLLAIIVSWAIMSFPAEITGAREREIKRQSAEGYVPAKAFTHLHHLPRATKDLLKNFPFMLMTLAESTEGIIIVGFATFLPKVIENQFGVSAAFASLLVGAVIVPAGASATLLGGWFVKRLQMTVETMIKFCIYLSCSGMILSAVFWISCPDVPFAGVNRQYQYPNYANYSSNASPLTLLAPCNENCNCSSISYDPVCGSDQILYFSPCHAGCTSESLREDNQIYGDCACIPSSENFQEPKRGNVLGLPSHSTTRLRCPSSCNRLPVFMTMVFLLVFVTFLIGMPSMTATLRCIPDTHRSLAFGIQGVLLRILGTVPGPIIFGTAIDASCLLWLDTCSGTGSCRHYDNEGLSRSMIVLTLLVKTSSAIFYGLTLYTYKRRIRRERIYENPDSSSDEVQDLCNTKHLSDFISQTDPVR